MSASQRKPSEILNRMRSVTLRERGGEDAAPPVPAAEPAPAEETAAATASPEPSAPRRVAPRPAPTAATRPAGEKPVRYTLDLSREQHRFLKQFALDSEVDASEVMRALLRQLQNDSGLASKVQSKLG
jgi:hypothetical protein